MATPGSIFVGGSGRVKCSGDGFLKAVGPFIPIGGLTIRTVASIIDGTYNNPSSGGAWSDEDPIVMETSVYKYELDGADPSVVDSTSSLVTNSLHVVMTPLSGDTFFGSVGDTLRLTLTKWNFGTGRLRLHFANSSLASRNPLDNSYHSTSFALLVLNGRSTTGNGPNGNMTWSKINASGGLLTETDSTNFSAATRSALDSLSLPTPGDSVILTLERISDNEITASVLDYQGNTFTNQATLTCNTSSVIDTNTSNVKVADITHLLVEEVSLSEIDLIVEKV